MNKFKTKNMAKGKIDMSKLSLGKPKLVKKKTATTIIRKSTKDDKAVQKIHDQADTQQLQALKEPTVRITVDVAKTMHKSIKMKAINNEITIREYILRLVENDLGI